MHGNALFLSCGRVCVCACGLVSAVVSMYCCNGLDDHSSLLTTIPVPELVIATTAKSLDVQPAEAQKVLPDRKCSHFVLIIFWRVHYRYV